MPTRCRATHLRRVTCSHGDFHGRGTDVSKPSAGRRQMQRKASCKHEPEQCTINGAALACSNLQSVHQSINSLFPVLRALRRLQTVKGEMIHCLMQRTHGSMPLYMRRLTSLSAAVAKEGTQQKCGGKPSADQEFATITRCPPLSAFHTSLLRCMARLPS